MLSRRVTARLAAAGTIATLGIGTGGALVDASPSVTAPTQLQDVSEAAAGSAAGSVPGNIVVYVPPAPQRRALGRLCHLLLAGAGDQAVPGSQLLSAALATSPAGTTRDGAPAGRNTLAALIEATGGSVDSSLRWCRGYLGRR